MTMLASWVGIDTHGISSAYIISDSRISWGINTNFDHGKKVFAAKNFPELFGYAGDVLFPSIVIQQIIEMIDANILFDSTTNCIFKNKIIFDKISYELNKYPLEHSTKSFNIIHISRDTIVQKGNYPKFFAFILQYNGDKWTRSEIPIPKESGFIQVLGSGKKEFYRNYDFFQYGRNKNTSRNVVHCFISTLKCINDPYCGGAPQIVGIYRKPNTNAMYFGIIYNNKRYFAGSEVPLDSHYINVEWRNEFFERCDGNSKQLIDGAQKQPYSLG